MNLKRGCTRGGRRIADRTWRGTHVWSRACPDRLKSVNVPQAVEYRPAPPLSAPTVPAPLPANAQAQESDWLLRSVRAFAPDRASGVVPAAKSWTTAANLECEPPDVC